jgi:hypothetical protein
MVATVVVVSALTFLAPPSRRRYDASETRPARANSDRDRKVEPELKGSFRPEADIR